MTEPRIAWLHRQLDDDEAYARNAFGEHNKAGANWREEWSGALNTGDSEDLILTNDSQVSRYMERFDPARTLTEVAAKREIIAQYEGAVLAVEQHPRDDLHRVAAAVLSRAVVALAPIYSGRDGYTEHWGQT